MQPFQQSLDAKDKRVIGLVHVIKDALQEFSQWTSLTGINRIHKSETPLSRYFWMSLFIIGIAATVYNVHSVIASYLTYPYSTKSDSILHLSLEFPAVTICNQNRVSCHKLFDAVLEEVDSNDSNGSLELSSSNYPLLLLYNITNCGPKILTCDKVFKKYLKYNFEKNETIPEILINHDECLTCYIIEENFVGTCYDKIPKNEQNQKFQKMIYIWKHLECDQHMTLETDFMDIPHPTLPSALICYREHYFFTNLISEMLIEINMQQERDDPSYPVLSLYNKTQCGFSVITCTEVLYKYVTFHFIDNEEVIPEMLIKNDLCFTCDMLNATFVEMFKKMECQDNNYERITNRLNFAWKFLGCGQLLINENETGIGNLPFERDLFPNTTILFDGCDGFTGGGSVQFLPPMSPGVPINTFEIIAVLTPMSDFGSAEESLEFSNIYEALPAAKKLKIGYAFSDFVLNCTFLQNPCSNLQSNFKHIISPTYGVCYIFNFGGTEHTSIAGKSFSLHLHLNVDDKSYLPELWTTRQGVRLAIHPPKTIPALEEEGIDIPVNMATTLAVKKTDNFRLQDPFKPNCTSSWSETPFDPMSYSVMGNGSYQTNLTYSSEYCNRMCLQHFFIKNCSCYHPEFPIGFRFKDQHYINIRNCNFSSKSDDMNCLFALLNTSRETESPGCDCNAACHESTYSFTSSACNWPSTHSKAAAQEYYKDFIETVDMNLLQLDIFYSSMFVQTNEQIPQYNGFADYISALGGALSLYLGISIVLFAEILQFFFVLCRNVLLYFKGRHHLQELPPLVEENEDKLAKFQHKPDYMESNIRL